MHADAGEGLYVTNNQDQQPIAMPELKADNAQAMPYDPRKHHRRSTRLPGYDYAQAGVYFVTICTQGRICRFGAIHNGAMHLSAAGAIVEACWAAVPVHFPHVATDAFVIMPNHIHGVIVIGHAPIGMGGALMGGGEGEETSPLRGTIVGMDGVTSPRGTGAGTDGAAASRGTIVGMDGVTSPRGTGAGADGAAAPRDALSWADGANADGGGAPKRTLGQIVAYFKYQAAKQINAAHGTPGAPVWQRGYYERIVRDDRALQLVRAYIAANPMRWARGERQSHR